MQALLKSKRTSLVPLFKLVDEVTRVRMEVTGTLEAYGAVFVGGDHAKSCFLGWRQDTFPSMLRPLQSPPKFTVQQRDQLNLNYLSLGQEVKNTIQQRSQALFDVNKVNHFNLPSIYARICIYNS